MFKFSSPYLSPGSLEAIFDHVRFFLEIESSEFTFDLELRPMQLVLIQGLIENCIASGNLPEEYIDELQIASNQITKIFDDTGYRNPEKHVSHHFFYPVMAFLSQIQLMDIDDGGNE